MAAIKLNPVLDGFSGKIGNLVFYKRNGKTFSRRKPDKTATRTNSQMEVLRAFAKLIEPE